MKKFFKKFKVFFALGLTAVLLSTSAQGSGVSGEIDENAKGGMYSYCVATGEIKYIPPEDTEAYSDETYGFSPGYNPYANKYGVNSYPRLYMDVDCK
ncbi:MAG: hypothetical protein K2J80_09290 [Oscillospiraceae bacterium]|nr:hypothetical protein [Oscillospiraceae bacterium]